ncbi:MAG: BppU family phage baseplate upper protein [Coprobacillus cateniformis]|jgi:hypothetical protein|nr:MAG TPA: BppU domain protein [Caudoviricetes sp.]
MSSTYKDIIRLSVDLKCGLKGLISPIQQMDNLSHVLRCHLTNDDKPINIRGSQMLLYVIKADKTQSMILGEVSQSKTGVVDFTLTEQSLALDKEIKLEIVKIDEPNIKLSFPQFKMQINSIDRNESLVESSNEFNALLSLVSKISDLEKRIILLEDGK